ncbi:TPA: hypothetical protein ACPZRZ_001809 [Yersinia enterocolitica]|uniref:hypothetical protein n=1 Tax=Enterobacterales TaxID=91347 RepID=UPI000AE6E6F7|nr:hypothetical protein [Serratia grimesii]ELI7994236.1 hypothetical protein [Yersinia enterocolitica]ELW7359290.1 hypothetical protein [Yersinia enterocolitica]ELX2285243.1 hypothetical protein [Yersinia enterocolitica]EMA2899947.1 hypothetical protein [Yersinia enterocolitica]EMB6584173.1 hypothetical protein [Yersinia enterocolitica]
MSSSLMCSVQTSSKAIRTRWGIHSSKSQQSCAESEFRGQKLHVRIQAALEYLNGKGSLYKKNNRNTVLGNFIARIIPYKNQAPNSQGSSSKSVKSTSSGSSDGSDPDPEAYSFLFSSYYAWSLFSLLISFPFVYACISIIGVVA